MVKQSLIHVDILLTKFNLILMDLRRFKTSWHFRTFLLKSTTNSYVALHTRTHHIFQKKYIILFFTCTQSSTFVYTNIFKLYQWKYHTSKTHAILGIFYWILLLHPSRFFLRKFWHVYGKIVGMRSKPFYETFHRS